MFKVGDEVAYGLHGKCVITAITTKELSSGPVSFYQIRAIKNPIAAKVVAPNEPAILVPVDSAKTNGLRPLMSKEDAETALKIMAEPDYHFELAETWVAKQKRCEEAIRREGFTGLAKVIGHLYVYMKQDAVQQSAVAKFYDSVFRTFSRELAETMGFPAMKDVEPLIQKALKAKLAQDN